MYHKQRFIEGRNVTIIGLVINGLLSIFKLLAGIIGRSQAIIADAVHSFSDVITDIIVIIGLALGSRPKDKSHPYGHGKFETIATSFVGWFLALVALEIGLKAIQTLISKTTHVPGMIALWAAVISIIVKEGLYHYTVNRGKKIGSQAICANAWHHRSDAFTSVASLIGVAGARAGFPVLDPLAALVVCFFILKVSFNIIKETFLELVETSIDAKAIKTIKKIAQAQEKVISVHGIKARKVGPKIITELHIVLDPSIKLAIAHTIAEKVEKEIISQFKDIDEVLVHTDPKE